MTAIRKLLAFAALVSVIRQVDAVVPSSGEFQTSRAWFESAFTSGSNSQERAWIKILHEDVADAITRGRSWRGTPYQIADQRYSHGIAFNANKRLLVHLAKGGTRFTAQAGLENNDDTRRGEALGNGSVTFQVLVNGREAFSSTVRRLKDPPLAVDVALDGAREFELRVGDGGDGRGWDQAVWADALVTLADGSTLRLQDVPLRLAEGFTPGAFSFQFNGKSSATLLPGWRTQFIEDTTGKGTVRQMEWHDPGSGLEVKVEATLFKDFPAVEWVMHYANASPTNSPILENIAAIDCALPVPLAGDGLVHWARGGVASFDDFAPQSFALKAGATFNLQSGEGRSSSQVLPFFNVEGANGGVIAAIGWSGEWAAEFACGPTREIKMKAGLQRTHLALESRESIRTPRMLLLFYEGDRQRGQNLLRQFLLVHHRPKLAGKPLVAPITCGNWGGTRADVHLDNIQQIIKQQLPIDYYWIDAEWYGKGSWPVNVGNWQFKADLYPQGFKPLSQALRGAGRELMLWFEPERVFRNTLWHKEHPEWLLDTGGENLLFNLGDASARKFLTDFISSRIDEFGLGCYRQDFNIDPLPFWRAADRPDRQGITEIRYIEGLYAFWDGLLQRHPGLMIDNCASGGRRIDLETVGRATPFWRTDGPRDAVAHQCHSYGLLQWVPLSATSQDRAADDYEFRSSMCSGLCLNWWVAGDVPAARIPPNFPFSWARRTLDQYLSFRDCYYGDFYPLTSYSQAGDVWMAYQLDKPDSAKGMAVAVRRPESPYETARLRFCGLVPAATYKVTDVDTGTMIRMTGGELGQPGLHTTIERRPGSKLILYERE